MSEQRIEPAKITKPIQLLAAWLAGLVLINGSFLATAASLTASDWVRDALVWASILNVPLFLWYLFLLQTKFRPEMQEDVYYAKYLELNTGKMVSMSPTETALQQIKMEVHESRQRYNELISSLDLNLKALALRLTEDSRNVEAGAERGPVVTIAEGTATRTENSGLGLDVATERQREHFASIHINDLLPQYTSIRRMLKKNGVGVVKTFGSSSMDPEVPKQKIISFGAGVPVSELREIVSILQKFGFDRIGFSADDMNEGRIVIGSYIYRAPEEPQPVPLTAEILKVLNSSESDLADVVEAIESSNA